MREGISARAIAVGAASALIGGVVWALVVVTTGYELGWIAWALGAFVGWAVARGAEGKDARLAWPAAGLAAAGLLVGKWLILAVGAVPAFARDIAEFPDAVRAVAFQHLLDTDGLTPELQSILDTLSDAEPPDSATVETLITAVDARVAEWTPDVRDSLVHAFAEAEYAAIPWGERIRATLSPYDLLWVGLAVATAWRLAGGSRSVDVEPHVSEQPRTEDG